MADRDVQNWAIKRFARLGEVAPTDAEFVVAASNADLTNERVLTNTASVTWDFSTPGQAKANAAAAYTDEQAQDAVGTILTDSATVDFTYSDVANTISAEVPNDAITFAKMQNIATDRLLGRDTAASGDPEELTVGGGVEFTGAGGIQTSAFTGDATKAAGGTALTLATVNANVGTFGSATQVPQLTANAKGLITAVSNVAIALTSAAISDFNEAAQDAIGAALTDTSTVDFTYNDGANTISAIVPDDAITYAKMQNVTAISRLLGRGSAAGAGDPEEIILGTNLSMAGTTLNAAAGGADGLGPDGDKGDVTVGGVGTTLTIDNNAVTYAKMQDVSATARFLGRITAGAGDPEEVTGAQATTLLDVFTSLLKGLVPASGGGTANFLRADGAFAAPTAAVAATTVEIDLGSTPKFAGKFTITDAAIGATSKVLCWQAPGPYTNKGTRADEAEMQPVQVIAVEPAAGSAVVKWQTPPMLAQVLEAQQGRRNAAGATFDRLFNQTWPIVFRPQRLGKVKGNVKFSYSVFA